MGMSLFGSWTEHCSSRPCSRLLLDCLRHWRPFVGPMQFLLPCSSLSSLIRSLLWTAWSRKRWSVSIWYLLLVTWSAVPINSLTSPPWWLQEQLKCFLCFRWWLHNFSSVKSWERLRQWHSMQMLLLLWDSTLLWRWVWSLNMMEEEWAPLICIAF